MLAARIIPTILSKNGHLVKGEKFAADRICGNALQAARIHAMRGVDELFILDVGDGPADHEMIRRLTEDTFTPVTVGGGITSVGDIQTLLNAGADKICLSEKVGIQPDYLKEMSDKFGSQCITVSLDYGSIEVVGANMIEVYKVLAQAAQYCGAGEILLQSVDNDGTMKGYDLELIKEISESVSIPVVASGGCSGYEDMYNALDAGASAVAVGALFQFTACTPKGAAEYLSNRGVEVRL